MKPQKIQAVIFDMVGVLLFVKKNFSPTTKDKLNLNEIEFEKSGALWKILPKLREKYELAVINNGNALAMNYWHQDFDFSIFNFFINSAQVGIKKPDPKIYLLTCQKLFVSPENCLFMDDTFENIIAAKTLGMATVWWNKDNSREENLNQFLQLINYK